MVSKFRTHIGRDVVYRSKIVLCFCNDSFRNANDIAVIEGNTAAFGRLKHTIRDDLREVVARTYDGCTNASNRCSDHS